MKDEWNFDQCAMVLSGEIELLKKISCAQNKVRQAVMKREWTDFEEKTAEVNRLGEKFSCLEAVRTQLFPDSIEEKPFYELIMSIPAEERRELSRLYRELKMETFKMRALNETFLAYLNEAKNLAAAYLEAVCPARGGKLYTSKGRRVSQDLKSIVINNRF